MDRRAFMGAVTGGLLVAPLVAEAQQAAKAARIAFISTTASRDSPTTAAFLQGLHDLGYIEGRNIEIEWRWGRGTTERFAEFAADVVRLKVDVIVAANATAGHAAQRATKTIPIVIPTMPEPVGDGFVETLGRPGRNITGLSTQRPELQGKRMQLLKEVVSHLVRMAVLADTSDTNYQESVKEAEAAGRALGLRMRVHEVRSPSMVEPAFSIMTKEAIDAVSLIGGTILYANRAQLADQALKSRLPMMCDTGDHVATGCLMSYGPSLKDLFRRAATYVDKILKGAKPGDLPVEQPTKFELVINLKTAKGLGLTIPPSLLARADQVIE